jgi:hypothetical protein
MDQSSKVGKNQQDHVGKGEKRLFVVCCQVFFVLLTVRKQCAKARGEGCQHKAERTSHKQSWRQDFTRTRLKRQDSQNKDKTSPEQG